MHSFFNRTEPRVSHPVGQLFGLPSRLELPSVTALQDGGVVVAGPSLSFIIGWQKHVEDDAGMLGVEFVYVVSRRC